MSAPEVVIEPDLKIVDPHHHLWLLPPAEIAGVEASNTELARAMAPVMRRLPRYGFEELSADLGDGHAVRATVAVEAHRMYRRAGPPELRSIGEIEFFAGIAAIGDSGLFGDARPCLGIVGGGIDLTRGEAVENVLAAHVAAGGGRYRGIRCADVVYDEDAGILGGGNVPHRLADPAFRAGLAVVERFGLSFDVWLLEPQLPDLVDLARAFPNLTIILNHLGSPMGVGRYAGTLAARFPIWRDSMRTLAQCPNVVLKIGGLGNKLRGFDYARPDPDSAALAERWQPYVETGIEAFGAERCMFESNFPIDSATCSYRVLWNAFKRTVTGASAAEKAALFHDTAARVYKLDA